MLVRLDTLFDNPIFVRELRRRMRGRGLLWMLILYIAAMCGLTLLIISVSTVDLQPGSFQARVSDIGRSLYVLIIFIQSVLVMIVAPSITAAMVRSEKERETFDFLRATSLTSSTYVVGAMLSTLLYVALALFCALPVLMVAYLYGGVSDVPIAMLMLLAASFFLSSGGMLVSCVREKKSGHVANAGVVVLLVMIVVIWGSLLIANVHRSLFSPPPLTVFGVTVPYWIIVMAVLGVISSVLLLMASRKLFRPTERSLSYTQFAVFYLLALALPALWLQSGSSAGNAGSPEAGVFVCVLFLILSLLMQNTMLLSIPENGNERWRVKKRFPILRNRDESVLYVTLLTAAGLGMAWLNIILLSPQTSPILLLLPAALYLVAHGALSSILAVKLTPTIRALKILVGIDAALLVLPLILGPMATNGRHADFNPIASLSPLTAMGIMSSSHNLDDAATYGVTCVIYALLGACLTLYALHVRRSYVPPLLNYELE